VTRIVKVERCDDPCPHHRCECGEAVRCRKAKVEYHGLMISRRFTEEDPYPLIPTWCPLEQVGPDLRPPERGP
jgi:hypothetical protein